MDKDEFLISWTKYDKNRKDPREGRKCFKTTTFKELEATDNTELCRAQLFVTESRVVNNMLEDFWKNWTNVTYVDIDSKHYWKDNNGEGEIIKERYLKDNPALVYGLVYKWIEDNYRDNISYAETSRSRLGFHFYFKWDCEKTEYNRNYFAQVSNAIVKKAFIETGYKHIIEYPKVFDDCTNSPVQFVYPTKIDLYHNYSCNGKIGLYNDLDINFDLIKKKEANKERQRIEKTTGISLTNNGNYEFVLKEKRKVDKVEYIEHRIRWRLFDSLSRIYTDPIELKQEWCECCKKIPLSPKIGAYTFYNGKKIKIWKTQIIKENELEEIIKNSANSKNGEIIFADKKNGIVVKTPDGAIRILEIQAENSKRMTSKDFLNGNRLEINTVLTKSI